MGHSSPTAIKNLALSADARGASSSETVGCLYALKKSPDWLELSV